MPETILEQYIALTGESMKDVGSGFIAYGPDKMEKIFKRAVKGKKRIEFFYKNDDDLRCDRLSYRFIPIYYNRQYLLSSSKMNTEIICDTMIWYELATGKIKASDIAGLQLVSTYINWHEFGTSYNVVDKMDLLREAIRCMFRYSHSSNSLPPIAHMAHLIDSSVKNDEFPEILKVLNAFAAGADIRADSKDAMRKWISSGEMPISNYAKFMSEQSEIIKKQIIDINSHKQQDFTMIRRKLIISFLSDPKFVETISNNIDFKKIELYEESMKVYFLALETEEMKVQENDFYDLASLLYVQPGKLFFTKEKRWKSIIKRAGMEKYLFNLD